MKDTIVKYLKIGFIVIIVLWLIIFVVDYFRARNNTKPLFCFYETNKIVKGNKYYKCVSLGYKYYEYIEPSQKTYGFGAIFMGSNIEKEAEAN